MVGVALPTSYSWHHNSYYRCRCTFYHSPTVFVVGSSSEQQMLDTLFTFLSGLYINLLRNRIFVPSDGVADDD
jgi:hypothetical protein